MGTRIASLASATDEQVTIALSGSVSAANAEEFEDTLKELRSAHPTGSLTLDASALDYVSSAGLRVLMRLRKREDGLTIANASPDVYDVFEMTGIAKLIDVGRRPREVSVEGCDLIGQGGFGTVYRLDPETIVKVYRPGMPRTLLDEERAMAQRAFLLGVPTAIAYDVVVVGDSFGLVFELLDADTVASVIARDPARVGEYGARCARLLRELHAIEVPAGELPDARRKLLDWADEMSAYLEPAEAATIRDYLTTCVPEGDSFLHGDFHPKNIMEVEGELMLLDIGDASLGHPALDLAETLFSQTIMPRTTRTEEQAVKLLGYSPEVAGRFWGSLASAYLGTDDAEEVARVSALLAPLALCCLGLHATRHAAGDPEHMARVAETLVRGRVLPALAGAIPIEL